MICYRMAVTFLCFLQPGQYRPTNENYVMHDISVVLIQDFNVQIADTNWPIMADTDNRSDIFFIWQL